MVWCWVSATGAAKTHAAPVQTIADSQSATTARQPESASSVQEHAPPADDYRSRFRNATTSGEMAAFIDTYRDADPDKLVPRAAIRMRTFAAFEAAQRDHQCNEAQRLHAKITRYQVSLPFSHTTCLQERTAQGFDPEALYQAAVRFEAERERASARTLYQRVIDRFPAHPLAHEAADRLAMLTRIEANESASRAARDTPASLAEADLAASCPSDLGYVRAHLVFAELRNNASLSEPIDTIIRKAGGLKAATADLEKLIRDNRLALNQASLALQQQYRQAGYRDDALGFRCRKPDSSFCTANYLYHLLKEGEYFYAEQLNSLRCRTTGRMLHAEYQPAPIGLPGPLQPAKAATKSP
jgi:hypothetical protein